jgi:hypothetical protein
MEIFSIEMFVLVIFAALLAMVIRLADYPNELFTRAEAVKFVKAYFFSYIAGFLGAWYMMEQGMDLTLFENFIMLVGVSVSGMAFVRGLIESAGKIREVVK